MTDAGTNTLAYTLTGDGHNLFAVERDATTGNAQIKVAGRLDHEVRSTYHLTLGVTGYTDPLNDYTLVVIVTVTDVDEADAITTAGYSVGLVLTASASELSTGETVHLTASVGDLPAGYTLTGFGWEEASSWVADTTQWDTSSVIKTDSPNHSYQKTQPGRHRFRVLIAYSHPDHGAKNAASNVVEVVWSAAGSGG